MKTIYLDDEFRCHVSDDGAMVAVETSFFDDKCDYFTEGYRFVPEGEIWTRSDGIEFTGGMVSPWKPYSELAAAQAQYERDRADLEAAYREGVNSI